MTQIRVQHAVSFNPFQMGSSANITSVREYASSMDDDAIAPRLGRLVIATARLELALKRFAEFLGEAEGAGLSQLRQIQSIRRLAHNRPGGAEMARVGK